MDPSSQPQQISDPNAWMSSTPPPQKKSHKKLLVVSGVLLGVLLAGAAIAYLIYLQVPQCLTREDYSTLAGEALPEDAPFEPSIDFYGFDVNFNPGSVGYPDTTPVTQIQKIGQFTRDHSRTSFRVTLEAVYPSSLDTNSKKLVEDRMVAVKTALVQAGVGEDAIITKITAYQSDPQDDPVDSLDTLSLSITSDPTCR